MLVLEVPKIIKATHIGLLSHIWNEDKAVVPIMQGKLSSRPITASNLCYFGMEKRRPEVDPERLREFRERLAAFAKGKGRKGLCIPAGISEATLSRILGMSATASVDNPGLFTVKALADAAGSSVGELLGENPRKPTVYETDAAVRGLVDDIVAIPNPSDREWVMRTARDMAQRLVPPVSPPVAGDEVDQLLQRLEELMPDLPDDRRERFLRHFSVTAGREVAPEFGGYSDTPRKKSAARDAAPGERNARKVR